MLHILLNDVRSALNIGSIFRSSDAFAIHKIWLTGICAVPPNKEILKTALGATESVNWEYQENPLEIIRRLKEEGVKIVAIEQSDKSTSLETFSPLKDQNYLLILGNEVEGVSQEILNHCETHLEIPQFGEKKSLNVSVSAGIVLWHFKLHQLKF
ncbi:MAG: TrmH family RNA methyltransferase [Bacteroidia bacterium]